VLSRLRLSTPRLVVLVAVVLSAVAALAVPLRVYLSQRAQVRQLSAQQRAEAAAIARLRAELRRWRDPAYLRLQATQRLQFVLPGQTYYEILGPAGQPTGGHGLIPGPTSSGALTASRPWYSALWGTVAAAGEPSRR
jgi:cell division protein FtsB